MGNTIWLDVDDGTAGSVARRDNSKLLEFEEQLDAMAERLNVTKLSNFRDYSTLAAELGDELGDLPEGAELPQEAWFNAKDGHVTFTAILNELRARPESLQQKPSRSSGKRVAALVEDLKDCAGVLQDALAKGQKFRLLLVP